MHTIKKNSQTRRLIESWIPSTDYYWQLKHDQLNSCSYGRLVIKAFLIASVLYTVAGILAAGAIMVPVNLVMFGDYAVHGEAGDPWYMVTTVLMTIVGMMVWGVTAFGLACYGMHKVNVAYKKRKVRKPVVDMIAKQPKEPNIVVIYFQALAGRYCVPVKFEE